MRLKHLAVILALTAALGLAAGPASATKRHTIASNQDRTVYVTRDENGRTHTRVIIHKRSFLDPGTRALPSDRNRLDYIDNPTQSGLSVLQNTPFGDRGGSALPGPFTLPSSHNPWLEF
jgi:hypothetical protein